MDSSVLSTIVVAYGADLIFGDPRWLPHPVRGLGLAIANGECLLRRLIPWERVAGAILALAIVGGSLGFTLWALDITRVMPLLNFAISVFLLYACLSTRDLDVESRAVYQALKQHNLGLARKRLAMIVGRNTERLAEPEIVRATLETIAESTMDGIVSPLMYAVLGGVPGAMAYKAVNTLDSMVGHRSARYREFGSAAAFVDTLANWIPARLTALGFVMAARPLGNRAMQSWQAVREARRHAATNSELTEAALAGAMGVQVGGVNWYQGRPVHMPLLGCPDQPLRPEMIPQAIRLMYTCSSLAFFTALVALTMRGLVW